MNRSRGGDQRVAQIQSVASRILSEKISGAAADIFVHRNAQETVEEAL
jgi:hypothetical protein